MPLKRTPPTTSTTRHGGGADSDLGTNLAPIDTENEDSKQASSRQLPRKRYHDEELAHTVADLKKSMDAFSKQQTTLQASINDIHKQNADIMKSMEFMSAQYEDMKNRFANMETERKSQLAYIQILENKIENFERIQKQASIEIRNIPTQNKESKEDLISLVQTVGEAVNVNIERSHIRDVFRLQTKNRDNRPIILDLSSVVLKEKILTSAKTFNKINKNNKLNTGHIKIAGQPKPIFVVECLTQTARKLYFLAREFGKKHDYAFCWTAHGRVFLRKREGSTSVRIDSQAELDQLLSQSDK